MEQQQAQGKMILPGELVRRVRGGAGLASLGEAQHISMSQASEQQGIEADTRAIVSRLESAWSGQSGDAARGGLQPLANVATASSTALGTGQNTLTDQAHAFQSTRDSLQEVSDSPPERGLVDVVTPWDTDVEDQINSRNAAIQQNNQIYQGFTSTSDGHAQRMPTDYGQMSDPQGDFTVGNPSAATNQNATSAQHSTFQPRGSSGGIDGGVSQPGQYGAPVTSPYSGGSGSSNHAQLPAAQTPGGDGTNTAGFVPSTDSTAGGLRGGGDATRFTPGGPGGGSSSYGPGTGPGFGSPGFGGGFTSGGPGSGESGAGGRGAGMPGAGSRSGGLAGPGRSTGAGRLGPMEEPPAGRGGTGAAGSRGANGMPMGAGGGKGNKEEDKEKKSASYLLEPDPNALFGYDGKATPPVIGK
ncbi:hypothetical protein ACQPXB_09130 [Amycolatopsis sp. CA-161197]|uniref:hypothetical protein n=1 Tax=Amycolatopsis sp. CA-161197 TaxID=3239922 RepID=UPI003D8C8741